MGKRRIQTKLNTNKIIQQAAKLKEIASKKAWEFFYNSELDELYFAPKTIRRGNLLFSIDNEMSIYLDRYSNLNGIFIEYFTSNFVKHQAEFKDFSALLTKSIDGSKTIPSTKKQEGDIYTDALQGKVLSELVIRNSSPGGKDFIFA